MSSPVLRRYTCHNPVCQRIEWVGIDPECPTCSFDGTEKVLNCPLCAGDIDECICRGHDG